MTSSQAASTSGKHSGSQARTVSSRLSSHRSYRCAPDAPRSVSDWPRRRRAQWDSWGIARILSENESHVRGGRRMRDDRENPDEEAVMPLPMSRRTFAGPLGVAAGVAILDTPLMSRAAEAATRHVRPSDAVILSSNENPYGPSAGALEAAAKAAANRYPDALEEEAREAIAKHHGVAVDQVLLGCGSSEILRMADMAFSGPGRRGVAAEPTFEAVLMFAKVLHADGVKVPLTADFRHDLPKMADACDASIFTPPCSISLRASPFEAARPR